MAFKTTLIIGLGGIGSRVVEGIYRKFEASNPSTIDRQNVAFICMDTDEADIEKRRKVMPASSVVKTSSDLSDTVGGYIARIQDTTSVLDWFDVSSNVMRTMPLNEGAAQIRMASRLAAISAIEEGKFSAIDNSITSLLSTNPARHAGNDIKIHIVSSLAGGTGAGSFLQVAYYVKDAMRAHGAQAPKVTGYFILADVLCDEIGSTFSKDQAENVRSNTYACVKELMAFCDSSRRGGLRRIEFEYKLGQRDKSLPENPPYDTCFMIDYTGANGGNLMMKERYEDQAVQFVYTNAFDPLGDNFRSNAINNVRQMIDRDGASRFASFGVSKLVYPVDDLMSYFSRRRVWENLSGSWLRIDNDYYAQLADFKKKRAEGIPAILQERGVHYREQVDNLALHGAGREGAEFKKVQEETKMEVGGEGKSFKIPKSQAYLENVERFVRSVVGENKELNALHGLCVVSNPTFTSKDNTAADIDFVSQRERALEEYKQKVMEFIDNSKAFTVRQCLTADYDVENYVSKSPLTDTHHLNTYILEKENEMHPMAVRYLLYDIQFMLKRKHAEKKAVADRLEKLINVDYKKAFDNPETKDSEEDATDAIKAARDKHSGGKKLVNLFSGQNPYKTAKELYVKKSKKQAADILKYSAERLLSDTYGGLLNQINLLIEESEAFFESIPHAVAEIDNEIQGLLKKHDYSDDPAVSFVLASEEIKKHLYDDFISRNDTSFFPTQMAASLYRSMYQNMITKMEASGNKYARKLTAKEKEQAALEANRRIIAECIAYQDKLIRENNKDYSAKNVIAALKEEADYMCSGDEERAKEYMKRRFTEFRNRAEIWGPGNLGTQVRFINAWGLHPDGLTVLPEALTNELFGATNVDSNPTNSASRIASEQFSPFEILRVNSVTLLTVEENFKKFLFQPKTDLTSEVIGTYYRAYNDVIERMSSKTSRTYSPHLDKRWHLPAYMPNIGQTQSDEMVRIFRALYSGLLFGNFFSVNSGGDYYWKYKGGDTLTYLKDANGAMIRLGNSQQYAIERLFKDGLANNPGIVNDILRLSEARWAEAKDDWQQRETDEETELGKMKLSKVVRLIDEFRFNLCKLFPADKNWFTLLDSKSGMSLFQALEQNNGYLRTAFYDDIIDHLIDIFGPTGNTRKLCEYVFRRAGSRFFMEAEARMAAADEKNRFQPAEL